MRAILVPLSFLPLAAATVLACGAPEAARSSAPTATVEQVAPAPPLTEVARPEPARAASACAAKCSGRVVPALVEAIAVRAKQAHRCYDKALATDKTLRGKVTVHITIGTDGHVCEVAAESDGAMQPVAACVAAFYRATERGFPPPEDGCVELNAPLNFLPRPDDAGAP